MKGEAAPAILGLYRHDAYCVENLLLCERAIRTIISQELAITEMEAGQRLGYEAWRRLITEPLVELFAAFATVHDFDPTIPTVSRGVGVLCDNAAGPALDANKVHAARDAALQASVAVATQSAVTARYNDILARAKALADGLYVVSGKDFLLPLLGSVCMVLVSRFGQEQCACVLRAVVIGAASRHWLTLCAPQQQDTCEDMGVTVPAAHMPLR